jgi:GT2 family glycosyltransferase
VDLSIIIVTWNTKDLTLECIDSIYENTPTKNFNFEIILIDNASGDGTVEEVKIRFPEVRIIVNPENMGFAKANNIGIANAKSPAVLLLNSDTLVKDDAIYQVFEYLTKQESDVAAVSCKLLNFDSSLQVNCRQFYTLGNIVKRAIAKFAVFLPEKIRGKWCIDYWKHDSIQPIEWIHMAFMMIRRPVLDQIGLLDERFYFYGEDMEFGYRLHLNNYKIHFFNNAHIYHKGGASAENRFSDVNEKFLGALFVFYDKYGMILEKNLMRIWFGIKRKILTLAASRTK